MTTTREDAPTDERPEDAAPKRTYSVKPPVASRNPRAPSRRRTTPEERRRRRIMRRVRRGLAVVLVVFLTWFGISFGSALANPSYGTTLMARAAEWGRDHHLGWFVTAVEEEWYRLHPPKVGGAPPKGSFTNGTTPQVSPSSLALPTPARLHSPAGAWIPGEGVWHPAGRLVGGVPAIYTTTVRPDAVHTSYVVGVAWMDTRLLRAQLYSGSGIPGGGPYRFTAPISPAASTTLDAAFNAGFKMQDANGGYYTQHRAIVPLRTGAASLVTYADGSATVGAWGTEVAMTPEVTSVRQNLDLIVNGGHPAPGLLANDNSQWGATLGGGYFVPRSGIGVTRDGALVYVGGPSLAITSLANLLVDAGAVRAMELDINPDWVNYSYYRGALGAPVNQNNPRQSATLLGGMSGGPLRYFQSWWIRDFYTMSVRRAPDAHLFAALP